jgi:hypothetical protein
MSSRESLPHPHSFLCFCNKSTAARWGCTCSFLSASRHIYTNTYNVSKRYTHYRYVRHFCDRHIGEINDPSFLRKWRQVRYLVDFFLPGAAAAFFWKGITCVNVMNTSKQHLPTFIPLARAPPPPLTGRSLILALGPTVNVKTPEANDFTSLMIRRNECGFELEKKEG